MSPASPLGPLCLPGARHVHQSSEAQRVQHLTASFSEPADLGRTFEEYVDDSLYQSMGETAVPSITHIYSPTDRYPAWTSCWLAKRLITPSLLRCNTVPTYYLHRP